MSKKRSLKNKKPDLVSHMNKAGDEIIEEESPAEGKIIEKIEDPGYSVSDNNPNENIINTVPANEAQRIMTHKPDNSKKKRKLLLGLFIPLGAAAIASAITLPIVLTKKGGDTPEPILTTKFVGLKNTAATEANISVKHLTVANAWFEWSTDEVNWKKEADDAIPTSIAAGGTLFLRGKGFDGQQMFNGVNTNHITISSGSVQLYGNINRLVDYDKSDDEITYATSMFQNAFCNSSGLAGVSKDFLPSTALSEKCYSYMFAWCFNMSSAPNLPATKMEKNCYGYMFNSCRKLVNAPSLPAETLAESCYYAMFVNCTGMKIAPALPATTLAEGCYWSMFEGCWDLTSAPALPAKTMAPTCYNSMFQKCSSLKTAPALPAETLATNCYRKMFSESAITSAPKLPATTLADGCYQEMFNKCSSLGILESGVEDKKFFVCPAGTLPTGAVTNMFSDTKDHSGAYKPDAGKSYYNE